jgi:hypothetical protein
MTTLGDRATTSLFGSDQAIAGVASGAGRPTARATARLDRGPTREALPGARKVAMSDGLGRHVWRSFFLVGCSLTLTAGCAATGEPGETTGETASTLAHGGGVTADAILAKLRTCKKASQSP